MNRLKPLLIVIIITLTLWALIYWVFQIGVKTNTATGELTNSSDIPNSTEVPEVAKPKLSPAEAKPIIEARANEVAQAIASMNTADLAKYIHPVKGVRFSLYGAIDKENDLVFTAEQMVNFLQDSKIYHWGESAGAGEPLEWSTKKYFNEFVYHSDFLRPEKINYNETTNKDGYRLWEFNEYPDAIVVEYYFAGKTNPLGWRSNRIIFEEYNGNWYIVGFNFSIWSP